MQYALLAYGSERASAGPVEDPIADVLARPSVTGWARLYGDGSATTVRTGEGRTLLTDGPFIETKGLEFVNDFSGSTLPGGVPRIPFGHVEPAPVQEAA